jgi:hypothetical protein
MWQFDLIPTASLDLRYVNVAYSDARLHTIANPDKLTGFAAQRGQFRRRSGRRDEKDLLQMDRGFPGSQQLYRGFRRKRQDRPHQGDQPGLAQFRLQRLHGQGRRRTGHAGRYDGRCRVRRERLHADHDRRPLRLRGVLHQLGREDVTDTDSRPTWYITGNTTCEDAATHKWDLGLLEYVDHDKTVGQRTTGHGSPGPVYALTLPGHDETYLRSPNSLTDRRRAVTVGLFTSSLGVERPDPARPAGRRGFGFLLSLPPLRRPPRSSPSPSWS